MLLYLRELFVAKKSLLIWTLCLAGLMFLCMAMFPSFSSGQEMNINDMLEAFPEDMRKGFGMLGLDLTEPMDFFVYVYPYVAVAAGIWGAMMGATVLGKEEGEKTIEFLYAKPVTRKYIFMSKLCAVLSEMIIFGILFYGINVLGFAAFAGGAYDARLLLLLTLAIALIMLIFMGFGFLLSVFVVKARKVMPAALGAGLGFYMLSILANIKDEWTWLAYLIPYKYFEGGNILRDGGLEAKFVILALGVVAVCLVSAWMIYRRKDILT